MKGKLRQSIFLQKTQRVPDNVLQLNGRSIPFVINVMYLDVTLDWRHNIERTVAKALRTYIRTYSLFKSVHINTNIKLTLNKALIRSVMICACSMWEYAADCHLLKLEHLQNRILCGTENLDRCTPVCELHVAFRIPYVYDYIIKLCWTQSEVILNHVNLNVGGIRQGKAIRRKY
jgi:hypothetical protein